MRHGNMFYLCLFMTAFAFNINYAVAKTKVSAVPVFVEPCQAVECERNFKEYKTLSRYGHSDAMYTLAEMYRIGYGIDVDRRLATKWYRRAAKYDNPFAEYKAAIIYLQEGKYQHVDKAMRYLRDANRSNLNEATHLLGLLHWEGELIPRDLEKAKAYLMKSYEAGHPDTVQLLSDLSTVKLDIELNSEVNDSSAGLVSPKGEMEVIEVHAPDLQEVFSYHIALMRKTPPDASRATGTLLRGRTCGEMVSCYTETDKERIRDFLMSTW
ncbi:hypothetical protein TUM4433_09330 [Shewanella schlegeliana]|nr:hypothetical protein TUM4433_09330 [Shewanella schlegeliana]